MATARAPVSAPRPPLRQESRDARDARRRSCPLRPPWDQTRRESHRANEKPRTRRAESSRRRPAMCYCRHCSCTGAHSVTGTLSPSYASLHVCGQRAIGLFVAQIVSDVREPGLLCANPPRPLDDCSTVEWLGWGVWRSAEITSTSTPARSAKLSSGIALTSVI